MSTRGPQVRLPEWGDEWMAGNCGCGARLVRVIDMTGQGHIACARSGWGIEKCPDALDVPHCDKPCSNTDCCRCYAHSGPCNVKAAP